MHKDYEKLLTYSFRLLSKKRYTVSEIEKKLTQYSKRRSIEDNNLIEKVINRLFELRYLNDQEYCNDFINSRIKFKPRGKYLLKKELILKGLNKDLIEHFESLGMKEGNTSIPGQFVVEKAFVQR